MQKHVIDNIMNEYRFHLQKYKPGSKTVTSAVRGQQRDPATRAEAMNLIAAGHSR